MLHERFMQILDRCVALERSLAVPLRFVLRSGHSHEVDAA